jgi:hypothetical protein
MGKGNERKGGEENSFFHLLVKRSEMGVQGERMG